MKSYGYAVAYMLFFLLVAHLVVGEPYLWNRHTISQLAAQTYQYAWIMRIGFIGFGILVQIAGIGRIMTVRRYWYREVSIMVYGLAILLAGIFSTSPFVDGVAYSEPEARLHSFFATSAGVALTIGVLLYALTDPSRRIAHWVAIIVITGISMLFGALPSIGGALQRLLWVVGFGWLVYLDPGLAPAKRKAETVSHTKS